MSDFQLASGRAKRASVPTTSHNTAGFVLPDGTRFTVGNTINLTAAEIANPTAAILADTTATYVGPDFARYYSNGNRLVTLTPTTYAASQFGILPGVDSTAGFAALASWYQTTASDAGLRYKIVFNPGYYYADKIEILKPNDGLTPSLTWIGAGISETVIFPNTTSNPVFFTIEAAALNMLTINDMSLQGIGETNPNQDGMGIVPVLRSIDNTGGVSTGEFKNFRIRNFSGRPFWARGGSASTGALAFKTPFQGVEFINSEFNSLNSWPSVELLGQVGQCNFRLGGMNGAAKATTGGPGMTISTDYRYLRIQPASADAGADTITANTQLVWPSCTPCRVIGSTLPAPLATGTTYFIGYPLRGTASPVAGTFKVASSLANAGTGTFVNLTSTGTPANYSFVAIYATALASDEFTTEFTHRLMVGDPIQIVGTNIPTGTALATQYYVIRTGHKTFKLANSVANAIAGTAISASGGTLADYGFMMNDGTLSGLTGPYSINLLTSIQNREVGLHLSYASDIKAALHIENMRRAIENIQSLVNIDGGSYQAAADDGGNGVLFFTNGSLARTSVGGAPVVIGTTDKVHTRLSGSVEFDAANLKFAVAPTTQTTGILEQLGHTASSTLDVAGFKKAFVNADATAIATITSLHTVGDRIVLHSFGGSTSYTNSDNITLPNNATTVVIEEKASAEFEMMDTIGTWVMVGRSGQRQDVRTAAVSGTAAITTANLRTGALIFTGGVGTQTLPTASLMGTELNAVQGTVFDFIVDNTAGSGTCTIAVNTGIVAATPIITGGATLTVANSATQGIGVFRLVFSSASAAVLYRIG